MTTTIEAFRPAAPLALAALTALALPACTSPPRVTIPLEQRETTLSENDPPAAARQSLEAIADGNDILAFEREDRGGKITYVAEWLVDGLVHEATVLADGSLVEVERELTERDRQRLPAPIRERIERLERDGFTVGVSARRFVLYELDADSQRDGRELLLRPDGSVAARSR
jgi:hypothetical protein